MNSWPPWIGAAGDDNLCFLMVTDAKLVLRIGNPPHVSQLRDVDSVILTKREAASYIRCTSRYLERQISAGRLKALKPTSKLVRIRRSDLDAFLENGATIGGVE